MKKDFISNNPKISINYDGQGDLIIFLHGIGGNKDNWNSNIISLSDEYLCVAWDARGYGESGDYSGNLDFDDMIEDLLLIFDYFQKKEAHIIGLSMGGQIACLFYEKFPKMVRSMILCNTHFGLGKLDKKEITKFVNSRKEPLLNGLEPKDIAFPVANSLIGDPNNKNALSQLVNSMKKLHKESYLKTIDASLTTTHDHIFKEINIPTLIIVGEKDKLTPPDMAYKIHALIKNSKISILKNAGHLTNIEKPELFNKIVLKFLKNINYDR